ncbi:hypothetical protein [Cohnella boryungensis]|uniref:Copper amine oxidase-like N-terminal domain-containing protein n=1 Tax=Cohnella boryungensis TaxID=768479 RepID=A0ABV8SE14_9BACL
MGKKSVLFLSLITVFALGVASATAAAKIENIKATINYAITTKILGKSFAPKDDKGKEIRPITYNGRIYVPAVQFANSLGFASEFKNNSLVVGEKSGKTDLIKGKYFQSYSMGSPTTDPDLLTAGGETYKSGFYALITSGYNEDFINLTTNEKFQKLTFKAVVKSGEEPFTVIVSDKKSGLVYNQFKIDANSGVIGQDIDIGASKEVQIRVKSSLGSSSKFSREEPGELILADIFAY